MIRFNRALEQAKVLSFDLDDTLYNNHPVIKAALQAQHDYLQTLPQWREQEADFWQYCREQALMQQPTLAHDVTALRKQALTHAMNHLGVDNSHAEHAYRAFAEARSDIVVADSVLALLDTLRQRFRLIAITNGNVDVTRFNLHGQFDAVFMAGPDGRAKPYSDLYHKAAQAMAVTPQQIIHIGDSLDTDVQGANNAGCKSVWLNNQAISYQYKGLADMEISDIHELEILT